LKEWLKSHPDYLRNYRASRGATAPESCRAIQDELSTSHNKVLSTVLDTLEIQDEISSRITTAKRQLRQMLSVIYKTSESFVLTGVNGP
jgi:hypothetical protein